MWCVSKMGSPLEQIEIECALHLPMYRNTPCAIMYVKAANISPNYRLTNKLQDSCMRYASAAIIIASSLASAKTPYTE